MGNLGLPMHIKATVQLSVSTPDSQGFGVAVGWANKDGFHMVGKTMKVPSIGDVDFRVGLHRSKPKLRFIVGVGAHNGEVNIEGVAECKSSECHKASQIARDVAKYAPAQYFSD